MSVEPNTQETIDFLIRYRGSEQIVLTTIEADGAAPVESETFRPAQDVDRLRAWLDQRQGKRNLYFTVNPTMKPMSGLVKARKEHIRGMTTLHVDLDPRKGEDLQKERERAERLITNYDPRPTFLIDSGGGFQGFWELADEQPTNGSEVTAAELEAYNQQIAVVLAADPCHNIDRIMRLPGTVNIPNAKKRSNGRTPSVSGLVFYDDVKYTLASFTAAPIVQTLGPRSAGGVRLSGNLPKADLSRLPEKVPSSTRAIIVQGEDPENLTRFPSRSEALFFVCCDLVRASVDDDTIASIILDRDLAISASVVDKPRPNEYAARQIQRAHEEVETPELRELNDAHAVISDLGGKCRVLTEIDDPEGSGQKRVSFQSFEDFRNRYMNRLVQVGKKQEPLGNWWLRHRGRRQYGSVIFYPNKTVEGSYNLWRGFAFSPEEGCIDLFLDHVFTNICNGNRECYDYLIGWMATAVQLPEAPGEVAIVLRGERGTGKSLFARLFGSLFGSHFTPVSDPGHLVGNFNAHLRQTIVLFADEAFFAGDRKHESILKTLITEPSMLIEAKGVDAEVARNCVHLIMASNDSWVAPAGTDERRFLVLDVSSDHAQDTDFFGRLLLEMDSGGRAALLNMLLQHDISDFNVRRVPQTSALRDQKNLSLAPHEAVLLEMLVTGVTPDEDFIKDAPNMVSVKGIMQEIVELGGSVRNTRALSTAIGQFLRKIVEVDKSGKVVTYRVRRQSMMSGSYLGGIPPDDYRGPTRSVRRTMYRLLPLQELRARYSHLVDAWPTSPTEWTTEPDPSDEETIERYEKSFL